MALSVGEHPWSGCACVKTSVWADPLHLYVCRVLLDMLSLGGQLLVQETDYLPLSQTVLHNW